MERTCQASSDYLGFVAVMKLIAAQTYLMLSSDSKEQVYGAQQKIWLNQQDRPMPIFVAARSRSEFSMNAQCFLLHAPKSPRKRWCFLVWLGETHKASVSDLNVDRLYTVLQNMNNWIHTQAEINFFEYGRQFMFGRGGSRAFGLDPRGIGDGYSLYLDIEHIDGTSAYGYQVYFSGASVWQWQSAVIVPRWACNMWKA